MREETEAILQELIHQESKESMVAKDADTLECTIQAGEYQLQGYDAVVDWIERARSKLRSKSSIELLSIIAESDTNQWWKKIKNEKLFFRSDNHDIKFSG